MKKPSASQPPRPAAKPPTRRPRRRTVPVVTAVLLLAVAAGSGWWYVAARQRSAARWQAARQAVELDDFAAARRDLAALRQQEPANPEAFFLLARLERRAGDLRKANDYLAEARRAGSPNEQVEFEQQLLAARGGAIRELLPRLRAAMENNSPQAALAAEALVVGFIQVQALDEAHAACTAWLRRSPTDWRAHFWFGWVLDARGFGTLAVNEYRRAVEANPGNVEARVRLAESLLNNSEYPQALAELERCREARPDDPAVRFALARCLQALGRGGEAEPLLQALVEANGRNAPALVLLARVRLDRDDPAAAVEVARRAAQLDPSDPIATSTLAEALRGVQSPEASAWEDKARTLTEQNERVASLTRDAKYHARDVEIRYQLGTLLLSMGRQAEAVAWFRRGLAIDANHQPTRDALARLAEPAGRPGPRPNDPSAREP